MSCVHLDIRDTQNILLDELESLKLMIWSWNFVWDYPNVLYCLDNPNTVDINPEENVLKCWNPRRLVGNKKMPARKQEQSR